MAKREILVIQPSDTRKTVVGVGDEYYFFATGQETDGQYFLTEALVTPGGGPATHIQNREEEAFYILEGEVAFYSEGKRIDAVAGTYLNIPKGVPHRFKNKTDVSARMLIFFAPAGIEGLFEGAATNPDNFLPIAKEYGVQFFLDEEDSNEGDAPPK